MIVVVLWIVVLFMVILVFIVLIFFSKLRVLIKGN